ncbi:CDP-glucose 4,6-dehydratase [Paramicrobacterium fandaimingii]|uniref:CDP-glucose 4,6-dehydratase n=1 Tax=Paramicrobacterium fandaimingii TaxID=2708079 RepID=UPI0014219E81|nr:CDP-glucose 4,6-dehydratase [Microbacterium fandaimingii]
MKFAYWEDSSVFVTGHTGFKGAWLCLLLARLGARVHGYALQTPESFLFQRANLTSAVENDERGDIRDVEQLAASMQRSGAEVVLHLAAQSVVRESYASPRETFSANVDGTLAVLEAARSVGTVRRVVVVTTDKVYRNEEWQWGYREIDALGGDDPYSASKAAAELATHSFAVSFPRDDFAIATARAGNVIGGGDATPDALIPELFSAYRGGRPASIRRPNATRPWQHVLEPLTGYLALAEHLDASRHDSAWNFGPSAEDGLAVGAVADEIARLWGDDARWIADGNEGPHEAGLLMVDSTKARNELDWAPTLRVRETLAYTVDWEKAVDAGASPRSVTERQIDDYLQTARERSAG